MKHQLSDESCSLRTQRYRQGHGLGFHADRVEQGSFVGRREVTRLAAEILNAMQTRIEATATLRGKWTWPCRSMLWDESRAYGLPLEALESMKCTGPLEDYHCTERASKQIRLDSAATCSDPLRHNQDLGMDLESSTSRWELCDGGDGGDDGPESWPEASGPCSPQPASALHVSSPVSCIPADPDQPPSVPKGLAPSHLGVPVCSPQPASALHVISPLRCDGPTGLAIQPASALHGSSPVSCTPADPDQPPSVPKGLAPFHLGVPVCSLQPASALHAISPLRCGGPTGLEGLLEGLTAQLMPLITELVKKAVEAALADSGLPRPTAHASVAEPRDPGPSEPKAKRQKGGGKDNKRKTPEQAMLSSGRGSGADPSPMRRGKGAGTAHAQPNSPATQADPAESEGWREVKANKGGTPPFELRAQDWDAPLLHHTSIGRKLDELEAGKELEAVVLASRVDLDKVRTILRGTAKAYRVLCVELHKDGEERIPGRVGHQLQFRQATVTTHTSEGKTAPRLSGHRAAPVKVKPLDTTVVFLKIPEAFIAQELWKQARSNPARFAASWAASHKVVFADTWGWVVDNPAKAGQQLYGKARLATKELTSLLGVSGQGGVFVDTLRNALATQVQWIVRTEGEPSLAYHERGLRMGAKLGLVTQGGRIGARDTRDPSVAVARLWNFPHVPSSWGPDQVTAVLTSAFDEVVLLHHRRMGKERLYRFRAKHKFGDKDIVPLQVTLDTDDGTASGHITMWATLAPPKPPKHKQQALRQAAVPFFEPKDAALAPKPVSIRQEAVTDDKGKETSPAQVRVVSQRAVPDKCKVVPMDKDGSCLYRAVASGLKWLSGSKATEFCHRDLRARANDHIKRHRAQYETEWDGQGPSLEPLRSAAVPDADPFAKYLELAANEAAYASTLEIKALSRLYDICITVIPRDGNFATMSFRDTRRKKAIVLWYTPKHVDLLLPEQDGQAYPPELFTACQGTALDLRAGGRGTSSKCSGAWTRASNAPASTCSKGSVWTRASNAVTLQTAAPLPGPDQLPDGSPRLGAGTAWSETGPARSVSGALCSDMADGTGHSLLDDLDPVPEAPADAMPRPKRKAFRTKQGESIRYKGIFQCDLCPFRKVESDHRLLVRLRVHHMNRHHGGQGVRRHRPVKFTARGKNADFLWRCPVCKAGILKEGNSDLSQSTLSLRKATHRAQQHPDVSPKEWLCFMRRQATTSTMRAKCRALQLNRRASELKAMSRPAHLTPFLLPELRSCKPRAATAASKDSSMVRFRSVWKCNRCGNIVRRSVALNGHSGDRCRGTRSPKLKQQQLKTLARLHKVAMSSKVIGFSAAQLEDIFASAHRAIDEDPPMPSSRF